MTHTDADVSRADMHCHSTASELSKLGVQRAAGLPECATRAEDVYELAKRRGMDFVTITDHDTIDGCLELADRPDVFISEELTAWFRGEERAVHVLCYGITPDDHEWLQAHARDLESCAAYLHELGLTCALAHPFYVVEAPLLPRHRHRLAELFGSWEVRNGSRARELNMPAAVYIETHNGTGIGGSDDHAGVDIGRTFTETPSAATPEEFLRHVREGRARSCGAQGSAEKWAHSAIALATRKLLAEAPDEPIPAPNPDAVLRMAERVVSEGGARSGAAGTDLGPADARALLTAWLESLGLERSPEQLVAMMQSEHFSHSGLYRRARREHERRLRTAVAATVEAANRRQGYGEAIRGLFSACLPIIPYVPATTFLGRERSRLIPREDDPHRVALVVDGAGSMHGVTHTLERIRDRGVPGYEVDVIGTDPNVDRRLPAAAEVEVPYYPGLTVGVPDIPALADVIAYGRYDIVHLASPGPSGIVAALIGRIAGIPAVGSYHTELGAYAGLRSGDAEIENGMRLAMSLFYGQCRTVLSPSPSADDSLRGLGIDEHRIARWGRGVDTDRFNPAKRTGDAFPGEIRVLYAGRLTKEKGVDLLAESFLRARDRDPRLHLLLAGGGPEQEALRDRLGHAATMLGWLDGDELARAYASSDLFLFCSQTDTFGQVILEAQASGLPVVAVDAGGPSSLIKDGVTGRLCPPESGSLSAAVLQLAASSDVRGRLARRGLVEARHHSWDRAFAELAEGYGRALEPAEAAVEITRPRAA